jgi:hypothetical protein
MELLFQDATDWEGMLRVVGGEYITVKRKKMFEFLNFVCDSITNNLIKNNVEMYVESKTALTLQKM